MKATEQYFPEVPFIMLYKVVLTFESVDEILMSDHSNESYWAAVLFRGAVYYAVLPFLSVEEILSGSHSKKTIELWHSVCYAVLCSLEAYIEFWLNIQPHESMNSKLSAHNFAHSL